MVAKVVISALIFSRAITKPLINPESTPNSKPAATPIHRLSVMLITTAAVTPAQAITDATDRSKSPEARQNSMPHATMPDMDIASPRPFILIKLPKFGTNTTQATNSTANTTSMP
ncbi:hypothetical protein D3C79_598400 [compost metagenome]